MKKLILFFLLIPIILSAQNGTTLTLQNSQSSILTAYDNEAITVDNTSGGVGFTSSKINPTCTDCAINVLRAQRVDCTTEYQAGINIRATITGTTVTSAVGTLIVSGTTFTIFGYTNIAAFKAIRTAASSVAMYCTYSRVP